MARHNGTAAQATEQSTKIRVTI